MNLITNVVINLYSIAVLFVIAFQSLRYIDRKSYMNKLFITLIFMTIIMLILDLFGRCDGYPGTIFVKFNFYGNFFLFLFNQIIPSIWVIYVNYQVYQDKKKAKGFLILIIIILSINAVLVILTQFYGLYYSIDENNIYHRGPFYILSSILNLFLTLIAAVFVYINRKKLERRYFLTLTFFALMPFLCIILQTFIYGIALMLNSVAISLLIVFINIQNKSIHTDYLTGLYNRKKLDAYLRDRIYAVNKKKTFSAIMLDLDNFKYINDTFGHDTGDKVLQTAASLLSNSLNSGDFIARFGGDEFFIVLDNSDEAKLNKVVDDICSAVQSYNKAFAKQYKIGFSMGYCVYDYSGKMTVEDLEKKLDLLMYNNKLNNKKT